VKRRTLWLLGMWGAACAALLAVFLVQSGEDPEPVQGDSDGVPVHRPDGDRAPAAKRARLQVRPVEAGPPVMFRGDRRHTARSQEPGPVGSTSQWSFETGGAVTAQAVVGRDGTIYVGSHDHRLYAIGSNGLERWRRDLRDRVYATALVGSDGNVYVGSDADIFWSFAPSGELRWRLATRGDADTGATEAPDGTILFAAGNSLYCVAKDGQVRWRFEAGSKIYSTPAVDDDGTVYVGSQDDHLYAVASDGRMRWSYRTRDDNDSSPVLGDDGTIYFGSDDHNVYALTRDGDLRWSADVDGYVRAPVALGTDGSVLVNVYGPRPRIVSLDGSDGTTRWFFPVTVADSSETGSNSGPCVDRDGNVYVGAHDDYVYSLAPTGELRWIFRTGGDVDSAPVVAGERLLLVGSVDGRLYALEAH